jgi:hypothetical protein
MCMRDCCLGKPAGGFGYWVAEKVCGERKKDRRRRFEERTAVKPGVNLWR